MFGSLIGGSPRDGLRWHASRALESFKSLPPDNLKAVFVLSSFLNGRNPPRIETMLPKIGQSIVMRRFLHVNCVWPGGGMFALKTMFHAGANSIGNVHQSSPIYLSDFCSNRVAGELAGPPGLC
jgi:hypothetical protein